MKSKQAIHFFRRGSFVEMIGIDADANKDQESLDASQIASSMLDAPSACPKRRGSIRRKSVLLGLNMEDSDSSDDESNKKNLLRGSSARRKSMYGDADEPSGMSLLNHRAKSTARRGN